jgi:DNA polymerase
MEVVTIDFETYYDKEYSLRNMTTESYIRDMRFGIIGVAMKRGDAPAEWYSGPDVSGFLRQVDYSSVAILCHNTVFDGAILSWHLGIRPKLWLDTMSMARPLHGQTIGCSLAALAKHYGLPDKGTAVTQALGKRRLDFTAAELTHYGEYCANDAEITYALFKKLRKFVPVSEIKLIDTTVRMFIEPVFELDRDVLLAHLNDVQDRKKILLNKLGGGNDEALTKALMSNDIFADVLRKIGVEPPIKTSPRTNKPTYAFAKTDKGFQELLEHENPRVQHLAAARVGIKSTLEETRTEAFLGVQERGPLPILLNYWGAHTGRYSGGDKMNLQNLPRKGALRRSMKAPEGYVVITSDLAQIEARLLAYVARQDDLIEAFAEGKDVYSLFASEVYGRTITKADETERFLGKTAILGLGYSMSANKFVESVRVLSKNKVHIEDQTAQRVVALYRSKNFKIPAFWNACGFALRAMASGSHGHIDSSVWLKYEANKLYMPNGVPLIYSNLRGSTDGFRYDSRKGEQYIYGGKFVENIIQALARQAIADMMLAAGQKYRPVLQVHDEIVFVVPEQEQDEAVSFIRGVMSQAPAWAPGLPIACEIGVGPSYGSAK